MSSSLQDVLYYIKIYNTNDADKVQKQGKVFEGKCDSRRFITASAC